MPLNYSKWDQLELSDDSDIEGHPNVDHKSLVRWKQRDIHEKREKRKHKIAGLEAQIACNKVLLRRITEIAKTLASPLDGTPTTAYFSALVGKLQSNPSPDCPPGNDPNKIEHTYDGMLLSLLKMVKEKAVAQVDVSSVLESEKEAILAKELTAEMRMHVKQLGETIKSDEAELDSEEAEQKKKITMDDLHDGFDSKYVPPQAAPQPVPMTGSEKKKGKEKQTVTTYEVLNPEVVEAVTPSEVASKDDDDDDDEDDDEGVPQITPALEEFARIPLGEFERSFHFIQQHRDVYVPGATDALFVAGFTAQRDGKTKYAKQCVHQSLLLQYCEKLGKDGVGVFFKKMISGDKRAIKVFEEDVERTYAHLINRVRINQEEAAQGREQIQLVAENPDTTITFNVPDGPPPAELVLEGPGTENMDIEEVRTALQFRWDIFQGFPMNLQKALKTNALEKVNKVLGEMEVAEAEAIVNNLDIAGILNFAENKFRNEIEKQAE